MKMTCRPSVRGKANFHWGSSVSQRRCWAFCELNRSPWSFQWSKTGSKTVFIQEPLLFVSSQTNLCLLRLTFKIAPVSSFLFRWYIWLRTYLSACFIATSLTLTLYLDAEPSDYVLHEGVLNNVPVGQIDADSSSTIVMPLVFLAEGEFKIIAQARILGSEKRHERLHGGRCEIAVVVEDGKR